MIRVIGWTQGSEECASEHVHFTEDTETPVEDFLPLGAVLTFDDEIDVILPLSFPMETSMTCDK